MPLPFYKYEGLGNDFLLIEKDVLGGLRLSTERAIALCDRHRGVGGDGVLILDVESPRMDVINSDGSVPEMCGNGIRCAALHLARRAGESALEVTIETPAGPHPCVVINRPGAESVAVHMAPPSLVPRDVPLNADAPWLDHELELDGRAIHLTGVSMGNPHAVTFDALGDARFEVGPAIQRDPHFPEGVNVGFVSAYEGSAMRLDVLERGAGWTQACGTGACAAAVAAVETGRARREEQLSIRLPGGTLLVTVGAPGETVLMQGPARFVFKGEADL
ncbi:MAG: diaminopimelate epimerase [Deltaproteobacteria bacterium]|nr:diaminopimelate epimerase [Deltaproteobacteria bacterium]